MSPSVCSVPNCTRLTKARGWCHGHWGRWRRVGDVQADIPFRVKQADKPDGSRCRVEDCGREHFAKDLCKSHYSRWRRHGADMQDSPILRYLPKDQPCLVQDCQGPSDRLGYCFKHYTRLQRHGSLSLPPVNLEERKAKRRAYQRAWKAAEYAEDPDRVKARHSAWVKANADRVKLMDAMKRRRRRSAPSLKFSVDALAQRLAYWGGLCWVCGAEANAVDHVKPLAKGGWHILANLRPICTSCNSRKRDKWPYEPPVRALDAAKG